MDMPVDYQTGPSSRTVSSAGEVTNDFSWIGSSTGSASQSLPSLSSIRREASKARSAVDKHLRSRAPRSRKKKNRRSRRRTGEMSGVVQRLRASPLGKIQSRTYNPATNYANNHALGEHNHTTGGKTHTFRADHETSGRMCKACWSNPDKVVGLEKGLKSITRFMVRFLPCVFVCIPACITNISCNIAFCKFLMLLQKQTRAIPTAYMYELACTHIGRRAS